ncbi:MAG: DUF4142 domain-containing protein [Bacteroidota bacterium]
MKKSINILLVAMVTSLFFACGSSNTDSVDQANDMNDKKDTSGSVMTIDDNDAKFLVDASDASMMEIEAGILAQQKSTNKAVVDFGKMMSTEHANANTEIQSVASMKSVTMPASMSEEHMKNINDLREKSGTDFDKSYMSMMVDGHKEAVNDFEKMSTDSKDDDIRAMSAKLLPTLKTHLEIAVKIEDGLKK